MANKRNFGPDFGPFGPNVDPKYFFRGFYCFEMLDIVASYHRIQFQETFFSIRVFFKDTDDSQDSRGKGGGGPSFSPLYHFHRLTNFETLATLHVR